MPQHIAPELVTETARFCASALRRKAEEIELAAKGAASPAAALEAINACLSSDPLIELPELCQRVADGQPLYAGSIADALGGFGEDANALRVLLTEREAAAAS